MATKKKSSSTSAKLPTKRQFDRQVQTWTNRYAKLKEELRAQRDRLDILETYLELDTNYKAYLKVLQAKD